MSKNKSFFLQIVFSCAILGTGVHKRLLAAEIPHFAETGMAPIRKNSTPRFFVNGDGTHKKKRHITSFCERGRHP